QKEPELQRRVTRGCALRNRAKVGFGFVLPAASDVGASTKRGGGGILRQARGQRRDFVVAPLDQRTRGRIKRARGPARLPGGLCLRAKPRDQKHGQDRANSDTDENASRAPRLQHSLIICTASAAGTQLGERPPGIEEDRAERLTGHEDGEPAVPVPSG